MPVNDPLLLDSQLCFPLYAAARRVVGSYTPFLKPLGLTYTQYLVLLVLWERDSLTVGEIGRRLRLDSGTLTPLLKKLQQQGLICRTRAEEDERVVRVSLTGSGRALREKAEQVPAGVARCIPLAPEEALTLYSLLYRILDGMDEQEEITA